MQAANQQILGAAARRDPRGVVCGLICALVVVDGSRASAADPKVSLAVVEGGEGVFGNSAAERTLRVESDLAIRGTLQWSLLANRRVLSRGEKAFDLAPGEVGAAKVELRTPPVREGVIFPAQLNAAFLGAGDGRPRASLQTPLWIFPRDPFANRLDWLEQLDLALLDPFGATAETLREAGVPYRPLRNVPDSEDAVGLLLVGEGVSWADRPGLPAALLRFASSGGVALCLAPTDGQAPFPGADEETAAPRELRFRRPDVVRELDKRLFWLSKGPSDVYLKPKAAHARLTLSVAANSDGWPWLDVRYASGGRLIVCGLSVVERWEASPTPRFLFLRLLETLAPADVPDEVTPAAPNAR